MPFVGGITCNIRFVWVAEAALRKWQTPQ